MRAQVIQHELEQLNKIMQQEYTFTAEVNEPKDEKEGAEKKEPELPKTTLIIVNKRVR